MSPHFDRLVVSQSPKLELKWEQSVNVFSPHLI